MDSDKGGKLNCYDNGPARKVSELGEEFGKLLKETCPQYYDNGNGKVCCNYDMLDTLATQLKYPEQLFSRCPACLYNFVKHFCATTCDPDQSLFINPTQCKNMTNENGSQIAAIYDVDLYLTTEYADDLYFSCSEVQYPQASNRVVDIMCGGTDTCSPKLWLAYLGDPDQNHNSPFPMKYKIGPQKKPSEFVPRTPDFKACNINETQYRCSCADCGTDDLCPPPPQAPKSHFPKTVVFFSILGVGLFSSLLLFAVAMMVGVVLVCTAKRSGYDRIGDGGRAGSGAYGAVGGVENDSPTSSVGSINASDIEVVVKKKLPPRRTLCLPCYTFGAHLENWIKTVFYHWGLFVAKFWPLVMLVGVGVVVLILGLTMTLHFTHVLPFSITTDPVKLWSAPNSRARQEKDYFDQNFDPFYRTEMLIFTAKEPNYFSFQPVGQYDVDSWTFGPVFTNDVLHEVWRGERERERERESTNCSLI